MATLCGPMLAAALIGANRCRGCLHFQCLHVPLLPALLFAILIAPVPSRPKTVIHLRRHPQGLEIRLDEPRHSSPDHHGHDYVPGRAVAGTAARVRPERAQRRPRTVRPDALSHRPGFDPRSLPALLYSLLLPRHHLIPLAVCVFAAVGLLFSLCTT